MFGAISSAHFSKVDEVAVAPGELIASVQVRPVRTLGGGTIEDVKVKEGDRIKKGDIILERDQALTQTEVDRLSKSAELIRQDISRLEAEREGNTYGTTHTTKVRCLYQRVAIRNQRRDSRTQASDS